MHFWRLCADATDTFKKKLATTELTDGTSALLKYAHHSCFRPFDEAENLKQVKRVHKVRTATLCLLCPKAARLLCTASVRMRLCFPLRRACLVCVCD